MKSLRRSLTSKDHPSPHISTPIPALSKPPSSILPPKKVIRALNDHRPQAPQELGFSKGDFFYVVNDIDQGNGNGWYEANNPMTGARGIVPKIKFEEFNKDNPPLRVSHVNNAPYPPKPAPTKSPSPLSPRQPHFYAVVQHDFIAERPDELDAKTGDHISVVAQSNLEWFVAKPIGRLGRPGLIPVSFVALHDPTTDRVMSEDDVRELMVRGDVPGVEQWKKAILDYKATSISLGVIDDDNSTGPVPNSPFMPKTPVTEQNSFLQSFTQRQEEPRASSPTPSLPSGVLISAEVVSWHYEMEEYWFRINAEFQPVDPSGSKVLPPAKQLVLFRVYNDFYDFQVELLNAFPTEAGRSGNGTDSQQESNRILPYMPGPASKVDDKVTIMRREELNAYLVQLCGLWESGADHILRHQLIRQFFAPKAGDVEENIQPKTQTMRRRYENGYDDQDLDQTGAIRHPFAQIDLRDDEDGSDGSQYDEQNDVTAVQASNSRSMTSGRAPNGRDADRRSHGSGGQQEIYAPAHRRTGSSASGHRDHDRGPSPFPRSQSPYASTSRTQSPAPERTASALSSRHGATSRSAPSHPSSRQSEVYNGSRRPGDESPSSYQSSVGDFGPGKLARVHSSSSANNPPISASNPNTAFVKIKIFDRLTRELIAIRVNPRVTHEQLLDKVRARFGADVQQLSYRNSVNNTYLGVDNDNNLKSWLDGTDKHVLYAD